MMKRLFFITLFFALSLATAVAQKGKSDEMIRQIVEANEAMQKIECDFVQTHQSSLVEEVDVSKGTMCFRNPDYVKWEYVSPNQFAFIEDGNSLTVIKEGKQEVLDPAVGKVVKDMTRMITNSIRGSNMTDGRMFKTAVEDTGKEWVAVMVPVDAMLRKKIEKLVINFDAVRKCALKVRIYTPAGDTTVIEFKNIRIDG